MELDDINAKRSRLEAKAQDRIREAMQEYREAGPAPSQGDAEPAPCEKAPDKEPEPARQKPLVYFSYPMTGYREPPAWTTPLREALLRSGYLVYNPWDNIDAQFGLQDLPLLNALSPRLSKSMCPMLHIPEEALSPFEAVGHIMLEGDQGDHFGVVLQCLWLLVRSSLVVCDLMRPMQGAGTAQELLYARQLGVPVIGLMPASGKLNPFAHRSVTALFSGSDLLGLLPLIRGYAPAL
jgi:hypothetical protein